MTASNKKVLALIPARSGSKRVKDKNIRMLGSKPLLAWSVLVAMACRDIDDVVVSTDSEQYAEIAVEHGAKVISRPIALAGDNVGDAQVVEHFLEIFPCDLLVYLRPTTPFRTIGMIEEAIRLMSVPGYDSLRSVEEMSESAFKLFKIKFQILQPLTTKDLTDKPNHLLPKTYKPNGYVDIIRPEVFSRTGSLWGGGRYAFVTPRTIEIDTEDDMEYARFWAENKMGRWEIG